MLINCNAISTTSSLKEMIAPGLRVMLAPLITGARNVHMSDYSFSPIVRSLHILVRVDLRYILRGVCSLWSSHGSHSLWRADGSNTGGTEHTEHFFLFTDVAVLIVYRKLLPHHSKFCRSVIMRVESPRCLFFLPRYNGYLCTNVLCGYLLNPTVQG